MTSTTYSTTQVSDAVCSSVAAGAGLDGEWVAWISDSETNAIDKLAPDAGPYVLLDAAQTVIALDNDDLTDGNMAAPINIDENGGPHGTFTATWTGTTVDGTAHANNCLDWTIDTNAQTGLRGNVTVTGVGWTGIASTPCSSMGETLLLRGLRRFSTNRNPPGPSADVSGMRHATFSSPARAGIALAAARRSKAPAAGTKNPVTRRSPSRRTPTRLASARR